MSWFGSEQMKNAYGGLMKGHEEALAKEKRGEGSFASYAYRTLMDRLVSNPQSLFGRSINAEIWIPKLRQMGPEELLQHFAQNNPDILQQLQAEYDDMVIKGKADFERSGAKAAGGLGASATLDERSAGVNKLIDDFVAELSKPIDPADPYVARIIQGASGAAQDAAYARGLGGGISGAATEQNVAGALAGLESERRGAKGQALGLLNQRDLSQQDVAARLAMARQQLEEHRRQFNVGLDQENARMMYQGQQAQGQGIGGLLGGLGGLAASFIPGLQGYAPQLMNFGSQTGAGFGGLSAGAYKAPKYNRGY